MKRKDKSINLDEVHEYEKTKNLVESDYDNVINKLDQDTYLRLKKIKDIHKKWKNNMLCAIGSIGLIFFSAFVISIWGLFMHPIFFFALLCEPAIAILSASFYKDAKKHENYNNLYKFLKKNQKWDKAEEYLKSFEKSNHIMNEDRLERFNFAENRYNHAIESASKDIAIFEQDRNKVLEEIDIRPEDKITLVEGDQTKEFSSLSSALPLIARMIKDKKIVITVKEENQAIDNAFDNTCSNTLSEEHVDLIDTQDDALDENSREDIDEFADIGEKVVEF